MATPAPVAHDVYPDNEPITISAAELREMRDDLQRFLMEYRFGM